MSKGVVRGRDEPRHTIAMTPVSSYLPPDVVQAWHATTDVLADRTRFTRALAWLSPGERARHDRFRHDADRQMFLLGRIMARTIVGRLAGITPTAWPWREGPKGRPEIGDDRIDLHFNLAHSAGMVVCAAAKARAVGVDVEDLERESTDRAVVQRYCAPAEIADIERLGEDGWRGRFLEYWTLKEAYLKARGLGIAVPLAEIHFTIDTEPRIDFLGSLAGTDAAWAFHLQRLTDRHLAALAVPADHRRPRFVIEPFPTSWLP